MKFEGLKIKHLIMDTVIIFLLVFFDRITKIIATDKLKGKDPFVILNKVFELRYLENRGAAFGVFQNRQIVFIIVSIIFVCLVVYTLIKLPMEKKYYFFEIVLTVLTAGAIGNMIDRATQNFVVDFFYFILIDFPIFNVADIYVTLSCIAFGITILFIFKEDDLNFLSLKKKKDETI